MQDEASQDGRRHTLRQLLERAHELGVVHDLLDRVQAGVDGLGVAQRVAEPDPEESLAERRDALLEERVQGSLRSSLRVDKDLRADARSHSQLPSRRGRTRARKTDLDVRQSVSVEDERLVGPDGVVDVKVLLTEEILVEIELLQVPGGMRGREASRSEAARVSQCGVGRRERRTT